MQSIEEGHCEEDLKIQNLVSDLVEGRDISTLSSGTPEFAEFRLRMQYLEEYVTAESSLIAEMNTTGLTLYLLERLRRRREVLKRLTVFAADGLSRVKSSIEALERELEMQEQIHHRFKEIMAEKNN
ncbi:hypothetical protein RUND412_008819 [Rhizina undulata]